MPGLPTSDAPSILNKSYTITAEIDVPQGGGEGMLVTTGGRFGGFGFYLLKSKPVFLYNLLAMQRFRWDGPQALTPGKHRLVFDFTSDGPGFGRGGTGVLKVDGMGVASLKIPHTIPFIMPWDETFDVGADTRTSVDEKDYQVPFHFTGRLDKLTFELKPSPLASTENKAIEERVGRRN
jgi:arylsulfatase